MLDLAVSLVTYNNPPEQIRNVLKSVMGSDLPLFLTIVDNSPNQELRSILPPDDRIRYVHRPDNPGFGAAHNLAIAETLSQSLFHLVVNPDVSFDPSILQVMVDMMKRNPDIGLVSPKVVFPDGRLQPLCKLLPTPWGLMVRRLFHGSALANWLNINYELQFTGYQHAMDVPYLTGAFMLMPTSVLATVGSFDERFFMYFEDTDLCRRIGRIRRTVFYPRCSIIHAYGKASYRDKTEVHTGIDV